MYFWDTPLAVPLLFVLPDLLRVHQQMPAVIMRLQLLSKPNTPKDGLVERLCENTPGNQ